MSVDQEWRGGPSVGRSRDRSTGGGNNEIEEWSILIDRNAESGLQIFSKEENKRLDSMAKAVVEAAKASQADDAKPKIQRVPFMLRGNINFNKNFTPKVVSVGPYHYKDTNLKIAKPIKLKLAARFIKETRVNQEALYLRIKEEIKNLRDCYDNKAKDYTDHKLAWIFLVDGCAILQFISISAQENSEMELRKLGIKPDHVLFGRLDLFLLDNQLPYQLLQLIMRSNTSKEGDFLESINKFIFNYIKAPGQTYMRNEKIMKVDHVHLLDLMRKILIAQPHDQKDKKPDLTETGYWHLLPNIEELAAAGVKLKPSETSAVRDITFGCGTLKLPPILVDDSTEAKFLNMAAYEMCPDFHNGFEVSTYIYFLDSLIDRAQDVKVLRENKILHNALGSDEDVAKLFNEISKDLVPSGEIYSGVYGNIQEYCSSKWSKWNTWFIQFEHEYFHSPWSVLAFVGAILALASSIIQTGYTVLSYHADSNKGN